MDKRCGTTAGYKAHRRKKETACALCKSAINEYNKLIVIKYPEKKLNSDFKTVYKITLEQYNQMLKKQNNLCAVCLKPETKKFWKTGQVMRLAVDHDHNCCPGVKSCGKCVRGLVCHMCNTTIGKLETDNLLSRVRTYLGDI